MEKIMVVRSKAFSDEQRLTLKVVEKFLRDKKIKAVFCEREALNAANFLDCSLVIAIGGDGTFLRSSHFIMDDTPLLGVNADIGSKEGFYMRCSRYDFDKKMSLFLKGKYSIMKLLRLEASINRKKVEELALNEYYMGAGKGYITSRYVLQVDSSKERQRSSGVIAATPTGLNAWAKSIGVNLGIAGSRFAYAVREPYEGRISGSYRLKSGIIGRNSAIKVRPEMNGFILVADSVGKEHPLDYGDTASIRASDKYLSAVDFLE
ncbi:NAD(+)/NADH kinase [Candidatus Woesearchaeota archaeon]|nr:NAD(+)/NADH kinase [Candidatus Woesearchaeota archaeon]MBI2661396.1 NAD(+)/NADH kinase [Candidatus Woesearchaeota archaeon]